MANDYWNNLVSLTRRTLARAEAVNSILGAIKAGFDLFPSLARLREERVSYGVDTGVVNAHIVTVPYAFTVTDGARLSFKPINTNTGAAVVDVRPTGLAALGNIAIVDYGGNALTGGEILQGGFVELRYNAASAHFRITNPLVDVGSVTTFDVNALTVGTEVDALNDYVPIHDASAGALRKVPPRLIADEQYLVLASQVFGRR